jgi:lipopolysaccharide transport system ATP-binding protein
MSAPIISIHGLGKRYELGADAGHDTLRDHLTSVARRLVGRGGETAKPRDFWALREVSFDVQPGEVVGIVGRNGAGKSTLLKLLSQISEPTEGEIRIRGRIASLLEVGTGFHPELSGRENVFLNGAILGMSRAEIRAKFDEIVAFAEIERFLDTPVKRYSSGMYVRLAFAVAAHLEPEILVVDEVLAVGDAAFQAKCLAKMDDVAGKHGRTVLFVSHNLSAVQSLCQTGVMLEAGRLIERGPIAKVLEAYQRSLLSSAAKPEAGDDSVAEDAVRITAWDLRGAGTGELHACFARETCRFVFRVVSRTEAEDVHIGFVLHNAQGELVLAATSLDQPQSHFPLGRGVHELAVEVRLPLRPGLYHLDVSLNSRARGQLERAQLSPALSVLPHGPTRLPEKWQGPVNEPATFDLRTPC